MLGLGDEVALVPDHAALFRNGAKGIVLAVNGDIKGGSVTVPSELFDKQSLKVETLKQCSGTFKIRGHRLLDLFQLMVF